MRIVEPIRDVKKINSMKKILKAQNLRDYALFTFGINIGLRISDILFLTFDDVMRNGKIVDKLYIKEKKTKKSKSFAVGNTTRKALEEYIESVDSYEMSDPLFFSRKKDKDGNRKAISRQQAYEIIRECAAEVGLDHMPIGTHTLRKTFGYHHYKNGVDLAYLQKMFNHSSPGITLDYIGITQDIIDDIYINSEL